MIIAKKISGFVLGAFVIVLLLPNTSSALAGFAEQDFEFPYSKNLLIKFNVPSDACPREYTEKHQQCIEVYETGVEQCCTSGSNNLEVLTAVNIAQTDEPTFIFGKSYISDYWLIFDIQKNKKIFSDKSYERVEAQWEKLGNRKPAFVDVSNYSKYFHDETERSRQSNAELERFAMGMLAALFVMAVLILGVPAGITFLIVKFIGRKSKDSGSKDVA